MKATHFVTGGTGFVGSNLILELLAQSEAEIFALVRPGPNPAKARLRQVLVHAARTSGYGESLDRAIDDRCQAVEGDIGEEACGIAAARLPRLSQFWHVAASLRFEDRYASEIYRTNVDGTRNALALAQLCGVDQYFNYVSTAYVAGARTGLIAEEVTPGHAVNNHYENSKLQAEVLVHGTTDLRTRIFRPSIVIGNSRTHAVASGFSGLYGFIRRVRQLARLLQRLQDGLAQRTRVRVYAEPDALINVIPVDVVVRQMARISQSRAGAAVFHVTNPLPPTAADVANAVFSELELEAPLFVNDTASFSWIDEKIEEGLGFYRSYFRGTRLFDRRNSDAILGSAEPPCRMDARKIASYVRWYADVLRGSSAAMMAAA